MRLFTKFAILGISLAAVLLLSKDEKAEDIVEKAKEFPYIKYEKGIFTVIFTENMTTNALWAVEFPDDIKLTIDEYVPDKNMAKMVGVGGKHVWKFEGLENFTGSIKYHMINHAGEIYEGTERVYTFLCGELIGD